MTRFRVNIPRADGSGVVEITALATHEGDGVRVWGARDARWERLPLTAVQRAQAEAAVAALASQQADLFAKGA